MKNKKILALSVFIFMSNNKIFSQLNLQSLPKNYAVNLVTGKYQPINKIKVLKEVTDSTGDIMTNPKTKQPIKRFQQGIAGFDYVTLDRILPTIIITMINPKTNKLEKMKVPAFEGNMVNCNDLEYIINALRTDPKYSGVITNLDEMYKIISEKSCNKK